MSDVLQFYGENYEGIEDNSGFAGEDLLPDQWAKLRVENGVYRPSREGNPGMSLRLRCDEEYAKSKKRSFFEGVYPSGGGQGRLDGLCVAVGLGPLTQRFGEPTGAADKRPEFPDKEAAMKALVVAIQGREFVGAISTQKSEGRGDQNRLSGMHRLTEVNLKAIKAAGYEYRGVVVKSKKEGSKTTRWLEAKPMVQAAAHPAIQRTVIE